MATCRRRSARLAAEKPTSANSSSASNLATDTELSPPAKNLPQVTMSHTDDATLMRPNERSAAVATRVFDTPELLEHILLQLDARSVLRAQQTNRTFRNTVNGSTKIKKAIGLLPDEGTDFHMPLWSDRKAPFHGLRSYLDPYFDVEKSAETNQWEARFSFEWNRGSHAVALQPLGSRCRSVYICQPPIEFLTCRTIRLRDREGRAIVKNEKKLTPSGEYMTVGDLQDAAMRARQNHESCCEKLGLNPDYFVISFQAKTPLREDDPLVEAAKQEEAEMKRAWLRGFLRGDNRASHGLVRI